MQLIGSADGVAFENWRGLESTPVTDLLNIAQADGIPVAWVPPAEVLGALLAVSGHEARLQVLSEFEDTILSACEAEIDACGDEWMRADVALAHRVFAAFRAGHREAAACLALLGTEDTFYDVMNVPRDPEEFKQFSPWEQKYQKEEIKERTPDIEDKKLDKDVQAWVRRRTSYAGLSRKAQYRKPASPAWGDGLDPMALFLPLKSLYTRYQASKGDPMPPNLSRHLVAHRPSLEHLNQGHCLIAVMLMTSFFAQKQTYCIDARMDDAEPDYGDA
ncbi:hypothetical protein [Streptomyces sp. NBC_00989]|uniref:hypothetical protein n=1 Tax=Streptomyces sp. NBC_00989 TaxID=2903705 RepID=UPI00386ABE26|nr:hypothetical protein OG714_54355 [Streptomyces sp. NBC_00989]